MITKPINEPIEVIVHFSLNSIHPLRFKWQDRAYKITKVHHKWPDNQGQLN